MSCSREKNSFPRFFVPWMAGNASRCSGQRWIEGGRERRGRGSSEAGEAIPSVLRDRRITRDFLKLCEIFSQNRSRSL